MAPPIGAPGEIVDRIRPPEASLRSLVLAPVMHGAAQWGLLITLLGGGTVILNTAKGFDAHAIWDIVERERVMTLMLVGDAMARPLAETLDDPSHPHDPSSLLVVGSGGALFSATVKAQLREHLPDLIISDSFGSSEMGAAGSQSRPDVGASFPMSETVAVLGEDLLPLPAGSPEIGRLARRGHIPLGYHKDEVKTAATFVTGPDGVRWAIPGDYGRHEADGTCTLLGRGSGCINTGGEKVYPEEVEAVLKSHPAVFDVAVVGVPHERFGEQVAAIVQPRPGHDVTLEELSGHCRGTLAGYKVPRVLKVVDEIARTPSGKADHRWAKSQFAPVAG
jgi:fatty-acyl-CoA synthase